MQVVCRSKGTGAATVVVVPLRAGFCVFCGSLRHSALLQDLLFAQRRGTQGTAEGRREVLSNHVDISLKGNGHQADDEQRNSFCE